MKRFLQRKPHDAQASTQALERSKVILRFGANLGAITVPGLQAAAQSAIEVIEAAQVSRSFNAATSTANQAGFDSQEAKFIHSECASIANDTQEMMEEIIQSLEGQTEADVDVRLKEDIRSLGR